MYLQRKQDLSAYYYLVDLFSDVASFVTIVDGFPTTDLVVPSISVEAGTLISVPYELGNRKGTKPRSWFFDVFGKNKSQRDEYAYRILNDIEDNGISVYDYDEGFPPDVNPTQIGVLIPRNIQLKIVRVIPEAVTKLYWRSTVSFMADYENS